MALVEGYTVVLSYHKTKLMFMSFL